MELAQYMNKSIENIMKNALKSALRNPKETAFLLNFYRTQKTASKKRAEFVKKEITIPPFLIASISTSCNLTCSGCYARANESCHDQKIQTELSAERWGRLFEEAKELGISFILLAGGEPFMRSDVLMEASKQSKILFPIFTNGTMISELNLPLFDNHRNLLPVLSIEGKQELTDTRRGEGVYLKVESAMDLLASKSIFYGVSITVSQENLALMRDPSFFAYLNKKGCKLVFFIEYVPVDKDSEAIAFTDVERDELEQIQQAMRKEYTDMLFISFPGDEKYLGGCLAAGRGFFHISATGDAEPCPFSPYSDRNIKDKTLLDAIQSPLFRKLNVSGLLKEEHTGGCTLFQQESAVQELMNTEMK